MSSVHKDITRKIHFKLWEPIAIATVCFIFIWMGYYVITFPAINHTVMKDKAASYERGKECLIKSPVKIDDDSLRSLKQLDISLRYIEKNQKILADRQADLINDVRQETNNNIDKLNLWLTFAIGIISVFGIFLPLILERRNSNETKQAIESMKESVKTLEGNVDGALKKAHNEFERLRRGIRNEIEQGHNRIDVERLRLREDYKKKKADLDDYAEMQRFRAEFIALSLGFDDRVLSSHPDRENLLDYLWAKTVESLCYVVKFIKNENVSHGDRRLWLMESFVLLNSFIIRIRGHFEGRSRHLDGLSDKIRLLLCLLQTENKTEHYWNLIYNHIDEIMKDVSSIRIRP